MYVLMIAFPKRRSITALTTAAIFVVLSLLPIADIKILDITDIPHAVNWNVILMISGTMIIVDYFIESKMPNVIAESLLRIAYTYDSADTWIVAIPELVVTVIVFVSPR